MDYYFSFPWTVKFRKAYSLPCPQKHLAVFYRNTYVLTDYCRKYMRRSMGLAAVAVGKRPFWSFLFEVLKNISLKSAFHFRNHQSAGGVSDKNNNGPLCDFRLGNFPFNIFRDVHKLSLFISLYINRFLHIKSISLPVLGVDKFFYTLYIYFCLSQDRQLERASRKRGLFFFLSKLR